MPLPGAAKTVQPPYGQAPMGLEGSSAFGARVQKVQRVQRGGVGALMGASINAALRQQEKQYNRPAGEEMHPPLVAAPPPFRPAERWDYGYLAMEPCLCRKA